MATKSPKLKVTPFAPFGDRLDLGKRWEKWVERFERDMKYNGVDPSDAATSEMTKMALLMHAGNDVEDLHDTLPDIPKPENVQEANWTDYAKSKGKLGGHIFRQYDVMILHFLNS